MNNTSVKNVFYGMITVNVEVFATGLNTLTIVK